MKKEDVILNKKINVESFVSERLKENENLFTEEELEIIKSNNVLIEKVYALGMLDIIF